VERIRKLSFSIISINFCLIYFLFSFALFAHENINLKQEYSQYFTQAEQSRLSGEFEKSTEFLEKSLNIAIKMADEKKQCESLYKLGLSYWNQGQLKKSLDQYENSLELAKKLKLEDIINDCQTAIKIYKLYDEGKNYSWNGEHKMSIDNFEKAIKLATELGSKEHELKCMRQMSFSYLDKNDLIEFKKLNERALEIAYNLNHEIEQSRCLLNLGIYNDNLNNYSEALNYYEQALAIPKITRKNKLDCLTNIGIIYKQLGEYEKALENYKKVLEIDRELSNDAEITMDLNIP